MKARPVVQLTNLQRESVAALPMGSRLRDTFDGDAARDLYLTDLYNMHMLRGAREGSVLLQSENGYPLIVEMVSGQGRWILSAFPWHTRATDLPLRNAFLPLVKSIFAVATEEGGGLDRLDASSVGPDWQRHPGFHDLGDRAAVVNLARTESDAETIAHQWFPASTTGTGPAALAQANTGDPGTPLWYWLALAALLFFCLESLVCRIFERRYPSATPDVS
ncbi:MAG: hypothetical protein LR015_13730 [Verrucomicrobia bacterium]|nr:hypothetical protein [Verrucomicrobiota bacterium]